MALNILRNSFLYVAKKHIQSVYLLNSRTMSSSKHQTLSVSVPKPFVYNVQLNRPEKLNALSAIMWQEIKECFDELSLEPDCRVIVLSAVGKLFCAGIDLHSMLSFGQAVAEHEDIARKCKVIQQTIKKYQDAFTSFEKCPKPVIAAVHGACVGAGVDMICAADIRYSTSDAWFQIKEIDLGMAADVGTLQRFPKIIGSDSLTRELVYTGRKFPASEALQYGFVNRIFENKEILLEKSIELAEEIAKKSPVAVQVSKLSLVYSRDHTVQEGLDHIVIHNQAMLQSEDFVNAVAAQVSKDSAPTFSKL